MQRIQNLWEGCQTNHFDLIMTPTAGYTGEVFAEKLDFDGDIVFYDYCSENVEIKTKHSWDEYVYGRYIIVF